MAKKIKEGGYSSRIIKKQQPIVRNDIAKYKSALQAATRVQEPREELLQNLYSDTAIDALLTSQINNRFEQTISTGFELVDSEGNVNDKETQVLLALPVLQDIIKAILDSELYGYTVVELSTDALGLPQIIILPRQHFEPTNGLFYPDLSQQKGIAYRETSEYGKWFLEFNSTHLGLLNKAVAHVLMKKFAQSCWSELCEIYGIPPRYIKTNTQDPAMLNRAESMMKDMGAAAWFIIDSTEEFQFANGVTTTGDVYGNLINLCNNELSMLISGAVIGQDTKNGNESKENVSVEVLARLVESDKRMVEIYFNSVVLPAFRAIGWITAGEGLRFRFSANENTEELWKKVTAVLPYKDVKNEWIEEKFGIPVQDKPSLMGSGLSAKLDFNPFG
ncbi:MAG: DUF935 domain-containing protein [Prevotellaceae bacterium]|jgi:phage gp29-like protein|nr:DUF935 domain-containing protein [Prevotellaceae bacterium]